MKSHKKIKDLNDLNKRKNNNGGENLPPEVIEELFRFYSDLKFRLLNNIFRWTIKILAGVFTVVTAIHAVCSVFDSRLHCAAIIPSNMVVMWIIFSITTFVIILGVIFLFTTDGKSISEALINTQKLMIDNKSFFGKILENLQKRKSEK